MPTPKNPKPELVDQRCAAQHFGPWMVESKWFAQAVSAVKGGTFKPLEEKPQAASAQGQDGHVYEISGDSIKTLYWIESGVARVPLFGQMTKGDSSFGGASSLRVRRAIRKAVADDRVAAIMLHIDSPGGSVSGTGDLAAEVAAARESKPVYAFIEDLGASAAYWVASQAERIFANATAEVGSIGTMTYLYDTSGLMEKAGVRPILVSTGKYKGAWVDGLPVTDDYIKVIQTEIDDLNEHFLAGVMGGRSMPREQLEAVADGRVFIAEKARQLGLIDAVSTFDAAFEALTMEIRTMDQPKFNALKAEHPEWIAADVDQAKRAGATDARTELKTFLAAFPGKEKFAAEQFAAGRTLDEAKASDEQITRATAEKDKQIAAQAAEIEKLKGLAGTQDPVATGARKPDDGKQAVASTDPVKQAEAEWDANHDNCQSSFSAKKNYVAYRSRELKGQIKEPIAVRAK